MGFWENRSIATNWRYDTDDDEEENGYGQPKKTVTTDNGRNLVDISEPYVQEVFWTTPGSNTVSYTTWVTNSFPPEVIKTPTDTPGPGVATVVPPLKGPPDISGVCLTTLPGYVITPHVTTTWMKGARFEGLAGMQIFGTTDADALYPFFADDSEFSFELPCTIPALHSTYPIILWINAVDDNIGSVTFKVSGTTQTLTGAVTDNDNYVSRFAYSFVWPNTGAGQNTTLTCTLKVTGTNYQLIAVQVPLGIKGGFRMMKLPGATIDFNQPYPSYTPPYPLTKFVSPSPTSATIPWVVNKNGGFPTPIFLQGNFYITGTGVGVNYVSLYSTDYTQITCLRCPSSTADGLANVTLVYQGGTTPGGCFGYVVYVESS